MPTATVPLAIDATIVTRFWAFVDKKDAGSCWEWAGARDLNGYGQLSIDRIPRKAHRLAWTIHFGAVPDKHYVCHRCDNPPCVNPAHLFVGTDLDNKRDAAQKHRYTVPRRKKLTLADRLDIFFAPRDRDTGGDLARRYGVSKVTVHHCRIGRFVGSPLQRVQPGTQAHTDFRELLQQFGRATVGHISDGNPDTVGLSSHNG